MIADTKAIVKGIAFWVATILSFLAIVFGAFAMMIVAIEGLVSKEILLLTALLPVGLFVFSKAYPRVRAKGLEERKNKKLFSAYRRFRLKRQVSAFFLNRHFAFLFCIFCYVLIGINYEGVNDILNEYAFLYTPLSLAGFVSILVVFDYIKTLLVNRFDERDSQAETVAIFVVVLVVWLIMST